MEDFSWLTRRKMPKFTSGSVFLMEIMTSALLGWVLIRRQ